MNIGNVNFASNFADHGTDVPAGMPPGPAEAIAYVGDALKRFPDLHVTIEGLIAEDDRVVVRNRWTDSQAPEETGVSRDSIWRIAARRICGAMGVFGAAARSGEEEKK